jgi:hypothetical protein
MEPDGFRERYLAERAEFPKQLAEFVRITQGSRATGRTLLPLERPWETRRLPQGSAYSERHQGSSYGYERP